MHNKKSCIKELYVGNSNTKIIYIDDFLINPDELVSKADSLEYFPFSVGVESKGYPGVGSVGTFDNKDNYCRHIDTLIKKAFGLNGQLNMKVLQEAFCLMTIPESGLGIFQRVPHFDSSSSSLFAVLLYLCDEKHGGTGFYRHKKTGYEVINPSNVENYFDVCFEEMKGCTPKAKYFSDSNDLYEKTGYIPIKYNRLVIYRGNILHSANILTTVSINANPSEGRLTFNAFIKYDV